MMRKKTEQLIFSFLLAPTLALLLFFFVVPALASLFFSLTDQMLVGQRIDEVSFVGFNNYIRLCTDPQVLMAVRNTVILLACAIGIQQALGFFIARLLIGKAEGFRKFVHACLYSGWLMPEVAIAFVFFLLFSIDGLVNNIIQGSGGQSIAWLIDYPLFVIILAQIWSGTAYSLLTYENAFNSLTPGCIDSARADGATETQILVFIIIPSIRQTIRSNTAFLTLNNLGVFGLIYMLTGGGPLFRSTNLSVLVFRNSISGSDTGYGLTLTFILFGLSMLLSLIHVRVIRE